MSPLSSKFAAAAVMSPLSNTFAAAAVLWDLLDDPMAWQMSEIIDREIGTHGKAVVIEALLVLQSRQPGDSTVDWMLEIARYETT